ncbi:hypothetical protein GA0061098_103143 [Bradyrhizobium shewense]|uniref:Uncharacterized protein n=1 Tax=Bradyrhizobium shewense TaxID=1761772 RepID=A0A1C3XRR3_9BRAD|nr:hypothetical protein GA0061098_103143 [Bradyrhizobium shewense]
MAHSRAVRLKINPATRWRVAADQREVLADRPTWDMSPANAGLCGSSSRSRSAILDAHQLFLTCIKYYGGCLLIEVSFPSKVTHMADKKTWRPIIFSCPDTGDRVQRLLPDVPEPRADDLHTITCAAYEGVHFIDPRTGAMIDAERS